MIGRRVIAVTVIIIFFIGSFNNCSSLKVRFQPLSRTSSDEQTTEIDTKKLLIVAGVIVGLYVLLELFKSSSSSYGSSSSSRRSKTTRPVQREPIKTIPSLREPGRSSASLVQLHRSVHDKVGKGAGIKSKWYKVRVAHRVKLQISLDIYQSNQDLDLKLYNSWGTEISKSSGSSNSEHISTDVGSGTYYIQVYAYKDNMGSSFGLRVDSESLRSIKKREDQTINLREFPKSLAEFISSNNEAFDDTDYVGIRNGIKSKWYRFEIKKTTRIEIELDIYSTGNDLDIELQDEAGERVAASTGTGTVEKIDKKIQPGTYYIRVYAVKNRDGSDFKLKVKKTGDPRSMFERREKNQLQNSTI